MRVQHLTRSPARCDLVIATRRERECESEIRADARRGYFATVKTSPVIRIGTGLDHVIVCALGGRLGLTPRTR